MTSPQLPPDVEAFHELREYIEKARTEGNLIIDKLPEAPMGWPGVDDPKSRFDWYEVVDPATKKRIGVFHAPKGAEL